MAIIGLTVDNHFLKLRNDQTWLVKAHEAKLPSKSRRCSRKDWQIFMLKTNRIILNLWGETVWGRACPRPWCLPQSTLTSVVSRRQHSSSEHLERRFTAQHSRLLSPCRDGTLCLKNPLLFSRYFPMSTSTAHSGTGSLCPSACGGLDSSIPQGVPPQLQCSAPHWQGAAVTLLLCWCSRQYPCHYRNALPFPYCSERKST